MRDLRSPHQPGRRRSRRLPARFALAVGSFALFAAGCTDSGSDRRGGSGGSGSGGKAVFALASSLQSFDACSDLLAYLKGEAADRVTPYGLPGIGFGGGYPRAEAARGDAGVKDAMSSASSTVPTAAMTPGVDYSTTNTVEAGIDEGDVVKTDGEYLYLIAQGGLQIVSARPGRPEVVGSLQLPGYATKLVKSGDRLVVTGQPDAAPGNGDVAVSNDASADERVIGIPVPGWSTPSSALWQVDVSDPAKPALQRQLIVDGSVLDIRVTDDVARFVVQTVPAGLAFVTPSNPFAEDRALESNKQAIAESEIEDWIGGYRLLDPSGKQISAGRLSACNAVSRPPEFHGFTTTTVLSVDLARGLGEPNGATVLADGQRVYASPRHLYVAIGSWQGPVMPALRGDGSAPTSDGDVTTAIHRFTFDADRSRYTATGTVVGNLMNDFSMSEFDGVLRVATTAGSPWGPEPGSESYVTTLRADGNELKELGRVGELGKGEQIRGVRFIDGNAYVVTFRQTDPLYVVDLSDPAAPVVAGELKMNGYSGYLHPIGPDRLLGVGQDADDDGRITGALVAVFDVSDPAKPTRTASYTLPAAWLNTEWDYQSFLWWDAEKLALITGSFSDAGAGGGFAGMGVGGVLGLDVADTSITERGRILPPATAAGVDCVGVVGPKEPVAVDGGTGSASSPGSSGSASPDTTVAASPSNTTIAPQPATIPAPECYPYRSPITRTVIVGPSVFSLSDAGVQANDLKTLAPQGSTTF
jgi:hypothetical protein